MLTHQSINYEMEAPASGEAFAPPFAARLLAFAASTFGGAPILLKFMLGGKLLFCFL